jgi:thioredoxin 1
MTTTLLVLGLLAALVAFVIIRTRKQMSQLKNVKESEKISILNDQNFASKTKSGVVLVDFWATWCMPCKMMVPVLNELAEESAGKFTIAKLDVDQAKATAARFKVRSIPTMIFFINGQEVHRVVGVKSKEYLLKEIERRTKYR